MKNKNEKASDKSSFMAWTLKSKIESAELLATSKSHDSFNVEFNSLSSKLPDSLSSKPKDEKRTKCLRPDTNPNRYPLI